MGLCTQSPRVKNWASGDPWGHGRKARGADSGGGSLSIWGRPGWSHRLQMPPPPSAWPNLAPTWPVATQGLPANARPLLRGTQMPQRLFLGAQVTHAPGGQWKRGSSVPQGPQAGHGGWAAPRPPRRYQVGWSRAPSAHILSSWPETQWGTHRSAMAVQRRLSTSGRQPIGDPAHPQPWQPQRSFHPEGPPPWPRVRGNRRPRLPAPLPESLLFSRLGAAVGGGAAVRHFLVTPGGPSPRPGGRRPSASPGSWAPGGMRWPEGRKWLLPALLTRSALLSAQLEAASPHQGCRRLCSPGCRGSGCLWTQQPCSQPGPEPGVALG